MQDLDLREQVSRTPILLSDEKDLDLLRHVANIIVCLDRGVSQEVISQWKDKNFKGDIKVSVGFYELKSNENEGQEVGRGILKVVLGEQTPSHRIQLDAGRSSFIDYYCDKNPYWSGGGYLRLTEGARKLVDSSGTLGAFELSTKEHITKAVVEYLEFI